MKKRAQIRLRRRLKKRNEEMKGLVADAAYAGSACFASPDLEARQIDRPASMRGQSLFDWLSLWKLKGARCGHNGSPVAGVQEADENLPLAIILSLACSISKMTTFSTVNVKSFSSQI
ncbi:hypothetical protein [Phyllobacterium bourgognense]|uniref:hypothetical protein n=1 Tax=Phyllobacterium bourgognense TaxID=314236 RepID=UPI000DF39FD2|nr:hypothetical protein [Phyllobacterium bourgognense]